MTLLVKVCKLFFYSGSPIIIVPRKYTSTQRYILRAHEEILEIKLELTTDQVNANLYGLQRRHLLTINGKLSLSHTNPRFLRVKSINISKKHSVFVRDL